MRLKSILTKCITDSFTFADYIRKLNGQTDNFMCSFDVSSLFANIPLDETIKICADALYNNLESQPCIQKTVFVELMYNATSTVEFSFDNVILCRQIDGAAMGLPLGPALVNIFVGYYEEKLFSEISKPVVYFRYVDDTFPIFRNDKDSEEFLTRLSDLHSSLRFTFERRRITPSLFWMSTLNAQRPTIKPASTANLRSLDNIYAERPLRR